MSEDTWPLVAGNGGLPCWDTPWGRAYGSPPPNREPATRDEAMSLPEGALVDILWGGGNGAHRYRIHHRHGAIGTMPPEDDPETSRWWSSLDARMIGHERWQHKLWPVASPPEAPDGSEPG